MAEIEEGVQQLVDILECDSNEARRILHHYDGHTERAIDAYFNGTIPTTYAALNNVNQYQQAIVPYKNSNDEGQSMQSAIKTDTVQDPSAGWDAPTSFIGPKTPPLSQTNPTPWADRASEGIRRSERNAKKRSSPIDLTGDEEDEDLRKAMQASLESESNRQKRHQEFGIGGNDGKTNSNAIHGINADDEALNRAIEASMLQSSSNTRDQTPALSNSHLEMIGGKDIRSNNKPVGIVPPFSFMRIFALALQVLYAAAPFRKAIMAIKFADLRTSERSGESLEDLMTDYWRGRSPANIPKVSSELWEKNGINTNEQDHTDIFMRMMTLFAFMTYTKRSVVVAEDVITHSPIRNNYAYVMNSERKPAHDILACYVQGLLDSLANVSVELEKSSPQLCDSKSFKKTFQSFTVNATEPQKDNDQLKHPGKPHGESYESIVPALMQTKTNNSVYRALYSTLAEEKSLYSMPAETLFFCLGRPGLYNPNFATGWQPSEGEDVESSFTVDPILYLDAFTFHRRNGVQLGVDPIDVKKRQSRIEELEKYRKAIVMHEGEDIRLNLRASIEYFQSLSKDDGSDSLRTSSLNEAGPRLEVILAHLEEEVSKVDSLLIEEKAAVERARSTIMGEFEETLANPEFQTIAYALRAILVDDGMDNAWAYIYEQNDDENDGAWWKVVGGEVKQVNQNDILTEKNTINFLVYCATDETKQILSKLRASDEGEKDDMILDGELTKNDLTRRSSESNHWLVKQPLIEAIEYDNAAFGRELAGEIPSSATADAQFALHGIASESGTEEATAQGLPIKSGREDDQMKVEPSM